MGAQTFDFNSVADNHASATLVIALGEVARVRFSTFKAPTDASLKIVSNGVTTFQPITWPGRLGRV